MRHSTQKQLDAMSPRAVEIAASKAKQDVTAVIIGAVLLVFLVVNVVNALT